jgi:predicted CXXCH cytochrome family protein
LKKRAAEPAISLLFEIQRDYNLQLMAPGKKPNMFISLSIKKTIPAAGAILLFLFSQIAWSGSFTGSPHDFRKDPLNSSEEICLPCHMMQGTKTLSRLLWDLNSPVQPYIMYDRTFLPTDGAVMNRLPDGMSKNCLSCHDGVIASEAYGPNTGGLAFPVDRGFMDITQNHNHPISFIYDAELAMKYGDLYDPSTYLSGVANNSETNNDMSTDLSGVADSSETNNDPSTDLSDDAGNRGTINADMLFSNWMECSSCHDVHNTIAVPGTKLLVKDSAGSELCLTCHNK